MIRTVLSAGIALALTVGGASTALAATDAPESVAEQASQALPPTELAKWNALTDAEKAQVNQVLENPNFGVPGAQAELEAIYPVLEVQDTVSDTATPSPRGLAVTTAATTTRSSYYWQNWTILGITYARMQTTINYSVSGSQVTGISACYGVITNYVPLRQFDKINTQAVNSDGTATCRTEVWLSRPLQSTVHGVQGLRVNGYGSIIKRWSL